MKNRVLRIRLVTEKQRIWKENEDKKEQLKKKRITGWMCLRSFSLHSRCTKLFHKGSNPIMPEASSFSCLPVEKNNRKDAPTFGLQRHTTFTDCQIKTYVLFYLFWGEIVQWGDSSCSLLISQPLWECLGF